MLGLSGARVVNNPVALEVEFDELERVIVPSLLTVLVA